MKKKYTLGLIPDIPSDKDHPIARYLTKGRVLPRKLDRSGENLPPRDQGPEGTCVAFAACGAKESQEGKEGYLSPRFLYERIKQPGGGAYLRDAMDVLVKIGVPPESCQPYLPNEITPECINAQDLAKQNKIRRYARLTTLEELKQCLDEFGCFMIGVGVTDYWFKTGDGVIMEGGKILGYHGIEFVGFDDDTELIKFKNSWSENWGENGYGYLGYNHLMNIKTDAWSFVDVPESEEEKPTPPPDPEPSPNPDPRPDPDPAPDPTPVPDPTPKPDPDNLLKDIINGIKKLLEALLSILNNLLNVKKE